MNYYYYTWLHTSYGYCTHVFAYTAFEPLRKYVHTYAHITPHIWFDSVAPLIVRELLPHVHSAVSLSASTHGHSLYTHMWRTFIAMSDFGIYILIFAESRPFLSFSCFFLGKMPFLSCPFVCHRFKRVNTILIHMRNVWYPYWMVIKITNTLVNRNREKLGPSWTTSSNHYL